MNEYKVEFSYKRATGGRTPFSGKYYYYVWFEEPPTEGEAHE